MIDSLLTAAAQTRIGHSAIGDDVAVSRVRGRRLVTKVDMLVESTDVPPGMSYKQAAMKAVAACVSDFAAKGVRPDSFLISLGLKKSTTKSQVESLGRGFRDAEKEWGVKMAGGDTNEANELVIDCAMFGWGKNIVERRGAKSGNLLVVTDRFGLQSSGLKILLGKAEAAGRFRKEAIDSVLKPKPNLKLGLAVGKHLTSAMDSSDGLARSLHTLAKASGVGFSVTKLPVRAGVTEFASANRLNVEELVLNGGEEYSIVGTVARRNLAAAEATAKRAGGEILVIGEATSREGQVVLVSEESAKAIPDEGWTHLS